MSVVLFTRLDGVFHPEGTYVDRQGVARCISMGASPFQFANAVRGVIARRGLQIVICASWLQRISLQQLRELAPHWMRRHIVGAYEQIDELDDVQRPHRVRSMWSAVQRYLEENGVSHWVALDTTTEGWPSDDGTKARLIMCSSAQGLCNLDVQTALENAAWQARLDDGVTMRATLVIRNFKPRIPTTQLHWQAFFRLPLSDGPHSVPLTTVDERTGEVRSASLEGFEPGSQHLVELAVKALDMTQYGSERLPGAGAWSKSDCWTCASFEVEVLTTSPFGSPRLRLAVEPVGLDIRVTTVQEEGWTEVESQAPTETDESPVLLVLLEALRAAQDERPRPF